MQPEMKQAYDKSGLAPKKDGKAPSAKTGGALAGLTGLTSFWRFAILFSFVVNAILFLVVLVLVGLLFTLKNTVPLPRRHASQNSTESPRAGRPDGAGVAYRARPSDCPRGHCPQPEPTAPAVH